MRVWKDGAKVGWRGAGGSSWNDREWLILAEKLRYLGVPPSIETRRVSPPAKARSTCREETTHGSFADVVRKPRGVAGEAVWVQIGESEVQGREESLCSCLVGWFDEGLELPSDFSFLKSFVTTTWSLEGGLKISVFEVPCSLLILRFLLR